MVKVHINKKQIGIKIKQTREKNNYSEKELAKKLSLTNVNQIKKWEKGLSIPSVSNIIKICNLFEISVDELIAFKLYM